MDGPLGQRVKKHVGLTLNVAFDAHYTEMYLNMVYQKLPLHIKFNKYPMSITMGTDVIKYKLHYECIESIATCTNKLLNTCLRTALKVIVTISTSVN